MLKDEKGYIVVETIGSFIPFILVMVSILSLVNLVTVQARVHNAITQAANTLSMYSYTLQVTGVASDLVTLDSKANEVKSEVYATKADIDAVIAGLDTAAGENIVNRVNSWGNDISNNPKEVIQLLANYGISEVSKEGFELILKSLVERYLSTENLSGDEYLRKSNVIDGIDGLRFNQFMGGPSSVESVLIDKNGDLKISVNYEINYKFGALPLPFDSLSITHTVKTKAWLNGSGEGY